MDVMKMQRVVGAIRRHIGAGEREDAIALYADAFGVDRAAAEQAIEKMAAGEPVAVTQSVQVNIEDVGRQIEQVLRAVPGGGMLGGFLKLAGIDPTKLARGIAIGADDNGVVTTRTSVQLGSGDGGRFLLPTGIDEPPAEAVEPSEAASEPAVPARPARRVSVLERQHGRTVERPRGLGAGGLVLVALALAAVAAVGAVLLLGI
jgi:hypothetical protein